MSQSDGRQNSNRTRPPPERSWPDGLARCPALRDACDRIERVAPTNAAVLITGETGTGKELVARAVHRLSQRGSRPLVAVNAGAIPETLVSSELFGHEPGAFTGAVQRRIGRFEQADHATLFLDEVGELSSDTQVALLRVLQEGEFERLGSSQTRKSDIRLITATHRHLEDDVVNGTFRADLFYRLSVFPIHLPPLRERRADIPGLVTHFLQQTHGELGRDFTGVEPVSLARLLSFSWPGNIRQLENIIEQSAILCDTPMLEVPASLLEESPSTRPATSRLGAVLQESEQQMIERALSETGGRVSGGSGAASRLGVPASTLESKIRRYHIDKHRFRMSRS